MLRVLLCCGLLFSGNLLAKDIPALLDWQQRMELGTLIDGMVSKVNVMVGEEVTRGSLLIEFDQREIQARLAFAESRVAAAKLQKDEARRELDRSLELYDRTLLSNHERIMAEIDAARADAAARQADAELASVRMEREYSRIKAPFDGTVLQVMAQPGQIVVNRLKSVPLVILADPSQMKAVARIDAGTAAALGVGDKVKVGVRGEWLEGEIIAVGLEPSGNDASRAAEYPLEVLITPLESMPLRAGEQVMVRIDE
jgi:multidrug efflux system membrane fusion protein